MAPAAKETKIAAPARNKRVFIRRTYSSDFFKVSMSLYGIFTPFFSI